MMKLDVCEEDRILYTVEPCDNSEDSRELNATTEEGNSKHNIRQSQVPIVGLPHPEARAVETSRIVEERSGLVGQLNEEHGGHTTSGLKCDETRINTQEPAPPKANLESSVTGDEGMVDNPRVAFSPKRVAVTGAGGFIASWIVKLLLERGYYVRGALRDIAEEKTAHLRNLEGAKERLELMKADIMHQPSVLAVVEGCAGVFHTACPVIKDMTDPETQMMKPAVEGTLNVLKACSQAHVKRMVLTSSIGAVYMDPNRPPHQTVDESCWSDEKHLLDTKEWYCLAKSMAERIAWNYAETLNVNLVSICPAVTLGTMLQPNLNQSSVHILKYIDGSTNTYENLCQTYVNVKDVAEAHILVFEAPTSWGRYLCAKWSLHRSQVVDTLACIGPHFPIPRRCKDEVQMMKRPFQYSNKRIEALGLKFTSFEQTLQDVVTSLEERSGPNKIYNVDHDDKNEIPPSSVVCNFDKSIAPTPATLMPS